MRIDGFDAGQVSKLFPRHDMVGVAHLGFGPEPVDGPGNDADFALWQQALAGDPGRP